MGSEGIGISQGQKQRLLIARAVYKNPEYLFFDESTNALDANNEKVIVENLQDYYNGKTVVIVAHRLSTVKNADKIVVLQNGGIVEEGNHEKLCLKKGIYYDLVKNQLELESRMKIQSQRTVPLRDKLHKSSTSVALPPSMRFSLVLSSMDRNLTAAHLACQHTMVTSY